MRRITDKGSALVKLDGPYGGTSSIVHGDCEVAVIFAGGIGVRHLLFRDLVMFCALSDSAVEPAMFQMLFCSDRCRQVMHDSSDVFVSVQFSSLQHDLPVSEHKAFA